MYVKFFVHDWGDMLTLAWGCRNGPPGFKGWHAGMTNLCQIRLGIRPPIKSYPFTSLWGGSVSVDLVFHDNAGIKEKHS